VSLHILVPCKSLSQGKSRLAPTLDEKKRHILSVNLLEKTLRLCEGLAMRENCHIVTSDPEVMHIASKFGMPTVGDVGEGLNPALTFARQKILEKKGPCDLLILPIDLPYATAAALKGIVESAADIAIAPDRNFEGTNALYLRRSIVGDFPFSFGENSFEVHCASARSKGLRLAIEVSDALSFDLDTPEHFVEMQNREEVH
jgi:2-phospho-L-lactate guanylyltransferase